MLSIRFSVLSVGFCLLATLAKAQEPALPKFAQNRLGRLVYRMLNDTSATASKVSALPSVGIAPETGVELGARIFKLYYARQDTSVNRLSEIVLYPFITFRGQFGLVLDHALYTDQNRYFLLGRVRYQRFPLYYYSIGPEATEKNAVLVNSTTFQLRQRVLRRVGGNWFVGPEVDIQNMSNVQFAPTDPANFERPPGADGSRVVGLGATVMFDSRKNVFNPRRAELLDIGYATYSPGLGNTFVYQRITADARLYRPLGRPNRVLAVQLAGTFLTGNVPFQNLALLGGDGLMRGYYQGRYRDKTYVATQAELRWLPFRGSKRLGATVFGGIGSVAPTLADMQLSQIRWSVGAGARFLLLQKKDVYLRADLGLTREGTGLYFALGEAF